MEYLRLLYELPAIVSGTTIISYMSPWKIQHRFIPLLMFIVGLIVLQVPEFISLALCLTVPAAWLQARLGIELHGHDPLKVTLPKLPKKIPLRQFVTKAYPDPEKEEPEAEAAHEPGAEPEGEDAPPEHEPPGQVSAVKKFVPSLLD